MDTIIYFYKKRGLQEPEIEPVGLKSYMLVRVGMNVGREEWFGVKLDKREPEEETGKKEEAFPAKMVQHGSSPWAFICHPLRALRQRRADKMQQRQAKEHICRAEEERGHLLDERAARLRNTESAMRKLAADILELADEPRDCFCVYDDSVRRELVKTQSQGISEEEWLREYLDGEDGKTNQERTLASMWRECVPAPEFTKYGEPFWAKQLLAEAVLSHFVILGTAPCLHEMIEGLAGKMKSLRWILLEEDCNQERLDFVEDFYTEYGLAITMQPMESGAMLRRMRLVCSVPVNVLDFTAETHIAVSEVAAGSVWLDMMSVEEKRRRVEGQGRGIAYFSLKEKWKHAQKRCNSPTTNA